MGEMVWVVAFDKKTGVRAAFTGCAPNNAEFYESKYVLDGYSVMVLDEDGIRQLAEEEKKRGIM